jgi:hypothetical protein
MMDLTKVRGGWEQVKKALPAIIAEYEEDIDLVEKRITLAGKTGPQAQKEQASWPVYYGMKKAEVSKLLKYIEGQMLSCRGKLMKKYIDNYSRDVGERILNQYINNEEEYLSYLQLYLEVEELKDKFSAICDAFDRRGFALRDWTQIKIAELEDAVI